MGNWPAPRCRRMEPPWLHLWLGEIEFQDNRFDAALAAYDAAKALIGPAGSTTTRSVSTSGWRCGSTKRHYTCRSKMTLNVAPRRSRAPARWCRREAARIS